MYVTPQQQLLPYFSQTGRVSQKILEPFLDLCVSSLREGHANLLCIVPILTDVAEATAHCGHTAFILASSCLALQVWLSLNPDKTLVVCNISLCTR